jgi:hypothetical protein
LVIHRSRKDRKKAASPLKSRADHTDWVLPSQQLVNTPQAVEIRAEWLDLANPVWIVQAALLRCSLQFQKLWYCHFVNHARSSA